MTILHVTDFHFNKRWFNWLATSAPDHDLLVMSGDLLDLADATPHRRQVAWISGWLAEFPGKVSLCSGNHDLEWNSELERWTPAYWLRDLAGPNTWIDGQRLTIDGLSVLNIGCTTHPKGAPADVWVVHAPPTNSLVSLTSTGGDGGDPDLVEAVRHHSPRLVLAGHVHDSLHWREWSGGTLLLNPGYNAAGEFPNHILIRTEDLACTYVSAEQRLADGGFSLRSPAIARAAAPTPSESTALESVSLN